MFHFLFHVFPKWVGKCFLSISNPVADNLYVKRVSGTKHLATRLAIETENLSNENEFPRAPYVLLTGLTQNKQALIAKCAGSATIPVRRPLESDVNNTQNLNNCKQRLLQCVRDRLQFDRVSVCGCLDRSQHHSNRAVIKLRHKWSSRFSQWFRNKTPDQTLINFWMDYLQECRRQWFLVYLLDEQKGKYALC